MNTYKAEVAASFDGPALEQALVARFGEPISANLSFARQVTEWQKDEAANTDKLDLALRYAAWSAHTPDGQHRHASGVLFKAPKKLDFQNLVPLTTRQEDGITVHTLRSSAATRRLRAHRCRHRSGGRARSGQLLHLVP